MSPRVLVINQYFPPDSAATGHFVEAICEGIAHTGAEVTAIVGQPSYSPTSADASRTETRGTLTIRRVPMGRHRGRSNLAVRVMGYARFLFGAWLESRRQARLDVVVTFHNPPLLGLLGAWIASRHRVPFVHIVQDIHPDIVERTGVPRLPTWLIALWRRASRIVLDRAALTITLSDAMKNYLIRTYGLADKRVVSIPLWAHPNLEALPSADDDLKRARERIAELIPRSRDHLLVLYAGNMGIMHPVETLVLAAAKLQSLPISFIFVGGGTRRDDAEQLARRLLLDDVSFLPFQPVRDFEALVQASDVCAVVLQAGLEELCLPSRIPTFMSASRPILAVMSERAPQSRELTQTGAGWCAESADGVAALLERLVNSREEVHTAGLAAGSVYRQRYQQRELVRLYVDAVLRSVSATN